MEHLSLDFYLVRNKEGKWFRRKGYGGGGNTWVDDIKQARVYGKIGPARGVVSFFASRWPQYGTPDIYHFTANNYQISNEATRIKEATIKRQTQEAKQEKFRAEQKMEDAQKALEQAQRKIKELQRKD